MEKTVKILVRNNDTAIEVPMGSQLEEAYRLSGLKMTYGPISARVNNKVEGMHYRVYRQMEVEFLDITSATGLRAYTRTLFFILCKAAHELFDEPDGKPCKVRIDIPISNGYYVDLHLSRPVTPDDANALRQKMQDIIDAAIPIHRFECTTEEAIEMFTKSESLSKVKLLKSTGRLYTTYYDIDGYQDSITTARCSPTRRRSTSSDWNTISTACCCASPTAMTPPSSEPSSARTRCSASSRNTTSGRTS